MQHRGEWLQSPVKLSSRRWVLLCSSPFADSRFARSCMLQQQRRVPWPLRGRSLDLGPARAVEMAALGDSLVDNPVGPGLTLEQSSSESKEEAEDAKLELVADEEHLRRLGALLSNARGGASALTKAAHAVLVAAALWIGMKGAGQSDPAFIP